VAYSSRRYGFLFTATLFSFDEGFINLPLIKSPSGHPLRFFFMGSMYYYICHIDGIG